jgi:hypothetical protein
MNVSGSTTFAPRQLCRPNSGSAWLLVSNKHCDLGVGEVKVEGKERGRAPDNAKCNLLPVPVLFDTRPVKEAAGGGE